MQPGQHAVEKRHGSQTRLLMLRESCRAFQRYPDKWLQKLGRRNRMAQIQKALQETESPDGGLTVCGRDEHTV